MDHDATSGGTVNASAQLTAPAVKGFSLTRRRCGRFTSIRARAIVMPGDTDLYFRVRDNELEVAEMPNAELRPILSPWGHAAGFGVNPSDNEFIDRSPNELLESWSH